MNKIELIKYYNLKFNYVLSIYGNFEMEFPNEIESKLYVSDNYKNLVKYDDYNIINLDNYKDNENTGVE